MEVFSLNTKRRTEFIDITSKVQEIIKSSGVESGIVCVFVPHTTAGITINEDADPSVIRDITKQLSEIAPENHSYTHMEGNSDSHIKSSLFGPSLNVIIENGNLQLGTWQGLYFAEFDGPRSRKCWVKIIKG
ncbi:MAG: secondary thiamine-phosphate synthase enzyme YjbQ [Armatimonadota bacterium]